MLTPRQFRLLERLERGPRLRFSVDGSGRSRAPDQLRNAGMVEVRDDPVVRDRGGYPTASYFITEVGRAALAAAKGNASTVEQATTTAAAEAPTAVAPSDVIVRTIRLNAADYGVLYVALASAEAGSALVSERLRQEAGDLLARLSAQD